MFSGGFVAMKIPMLWKALPLAWFETLRACTYFEIPDGKGKYISARSMEWYPNHPKYGGVFDWNLATHPKKETYWMMLDGKKQKAKYGHISVDANVSKEMLSKGLNFAVDGLNEKGLSVSVNVFNTMKVLEYSSARASEVENPVFYAFIPRWALSNFSSTDEVREALQDVTAVNLKDFMSDGHPAFGAHFAFSDKQGKSIVVEYNGVNGSIGKPNIYDNTARTLTNDPDYPWMLLNLDSFSYLSPMELNNLTVHPNPKGRNADLLLNPSGLEYPFDVIPESVSSGYNLKGLPGDTTPQSRFVHAFYFAKYAVLNAAPKGSSCVFSLAQAIFNSVFIPIGVEGPDPAQQTEDPLNPTSFTQWAAIKAPHLGKRGTFMIRSYVDMQWRSFDLAEARLGPGAPPMKVPVETGELNVANGIGTLERYPKDEESKDEESQDARRLRRLQGIPCTSGAGLDRSKGFSCNFGADDSVPHRKIAPDSVVSPQLMTTMVVGVACLMCGTGAGYLLGQQGKTSPNSPME